MPRYLVLGLCWALLVPAPFALAFDGIRVTLLGTGSGAAALAERAGPSVLVEVGRDVLLFDCGRGVAARLAAAGMSPAKVQKVFLTNLGSDRTVGCADLWLSGWHRGRDEPLPVTGPQGTVEMMGHLQRAYALDIQARFRENKAGARIDASDISENLVYESEHSRVMAFVVNHGPMDPAYGYRIESGSRAVVISGATTYSENLIQNARRASVIIHEVMAVHGDFLEDSERLRKELATHTTPEDAAKVLRATRPGLAVLSPVEFVEVKDSEVMRRVRRQYPGTLEMGYDLMVIEIQNEIQLRGVPSDRPPGR
ncbi:MAG: MBL fold metallo-hydrolase [Betaproteobacteria bacterium]|nr:MBL fold metallo-hydrolase [Betaproteobacteria bacterium]